MARPIRKKPIKVENLSKVAVKEDNLLAKSKISPSGKEALSFWTNISNEELHMFRENKDLLTELQKLVIQDPYFYFVRSEPNGVSVFSNSKGSIALPVTSFKLGTCVHM